MNPDQLIKILTDNISFQLRHANYMRTLEIKKVAKMISAAVGWEDEVTRYRRFEDDDLKDQRIRLHNPPSKSALAAPRRYFKRMTRIEGIRRNFKVITGNENDLNDLKDHFYNFMPGESLEQWQNRVMEYFGVNDPNTWIIAERNDTRNVEGSTIKTTIFPFVVPSEDVLNFKKTYGKLDWLLVRVSEMQPVGDASGRIDQILENYFLYAPGYIAQAREVGAMTVMEKGDVVMSIPVYPSADSKEIRTDTGQLVGFKYDGGPKERKFYVRVKTNGTAEVPGDCVGVYYDESQGKMECFVPWFDPAHDDFKDLIRYKSTADVLLTTHAYPHTYEFSPACIDTSQEYGQCDGGYYSGIRDREHMCSGCSGTGISANFTTEQQRIIMVLPEDGNMQNIIELAKLSHTQEIKTELLIWLDNKIEATTAKIMNTLFGAGLFQKPNDSKTMTATEIKSLTEGVSDILAPFGAVESRMFELFYRIGAQYRGFKIEVDKSYPDDLQIEGLSDLVNQFGAIKTNGVGYEAMAAQRARIFQKQFEGNPSMQKAIDARYKFKPWDDKTDEQVSMIAAGRSTEDPARVLWENHLNIFQQIEFNHPMFYEYNYQMQKAIVDAEVVLMTEKIKMPDVDPVQPVTFNEPNDVNALDPSADVAPGQAN